MGAADSEFRDVAGDILDALREVGSDLSEDKLGFIAPAGLQISSDDEVEVKGCFN